MEPQDSSAVKVNKEDLFGLWGVDNCEFIGYYHKESKSGMYIIDDLRKTNFDHIPRYLLTKRPIEIKLNRPLDDLLPDNYYRFTWKLSHQNNDNPHEICLDNESSPQEISPKWFIDKLFEDRHNDNSKNFGSAVGFLDTLSKQLSAKESTFVYELLQNANDYPVEGKMVDVEFHITDNYLLFLHSGDKFNVRNISGICGINEKEKIANRKTIGYKGIGFKTVFLNNHYVYIRTGEYSFRFDQGETPEKKQNGGKIKRQNAPFQVLPIWTEHDEVSTEVNSVFDKVDKRFQVKIALRPDSPKKLHSGKNCYKKLFSDVFSDSNIILFVPNIQSVRVFVKGLEIKNCNRNNEKWIVSDYEHEIEKSFQEIVNKTIEKESSRIPEKYKDFDKTKVSFACKRKENRIEPIKNANIYCYLPTKASWGLPFLMNTDMIPKGDRNDIETEVRLIDEEESNFNEYLASIAGNEFFSWIRDLLTSKLYHVGSVFSLIPDFHKCENEHRDYIDFINQFEDAFNCRLDEEEIVPTSNNELAKVVGVVCDKTGLSASGIMTDDEFLNFTNFNGYCLASKELRNDKYFKTFLDRYAQEDQIFNDDSLLELVENEDFQEWLKNQENNNKFLDYLLKNNYLEDFIDKGIFIEEECGKLFAAAELYYDIDKVLEDLSDFSDYLAYLSFETRKYFKNNKKWNEFIKGKFDQYDGESFIKKTLLKENRVETIERLNNWDTSYHFFSYIAKNNIVPDDLLSLPFFNDNSEVVEDFDQYFVFFPSKEGKETCSARWLSGINITFLSSKYDGHTQKFLRENECVCDYSDQVIVEQIILSEDLSNEVNIYQQNDCNTSKDFVGFCYKNESLFKEGSLKKYALSSSDCNGDRVFVLSEDLIYFPSEQFDNYSRKEWLKYDWMYCLYPEYLKIDADSTKVKSFLEKAFLIKECDAENFYTQIVENKIDEIIGNTSGSIDSDGNKNVDFVSYLDDNYQLIFEQHQDAKKFRSFVFLDYKGNDIGSKESYVYSYDKELIKTIESEWFPDDTVKICTERYGNSKSVVAIKAKRYRFSDFFDDVIKEEIDAINKKISSKKDSIDFHNFIIDHSSDLSDNQKAVMKAAKVYLSGCDAPSSESTGHNLFSEEAKKLADKKLVEFSQLDIIDSDYHVDKNLSYWKDCLGNELFTKMSFLKWLDNNHTTFYETIQDKEKNIDFWRWLKGCNFSEENLMKLPSLPICLNNGESADKGKTIYLSNDYVKDIEELVKRYKTGCLHISKDYIDRRDKIDSWIEFWRKIGIKLDIVDIFIDIIKNGTQTYNAKLADDIAMMINEIDKEYED